MDLADIIATDLQNEIIGPNILKEYGEQGTKRMKDDKYMKILGFYVMSIIQDFENYLRKEIDLVEDDIKLVLDEHNSNFITYELERGIYTFKDLSEALLRFLQPEYKRHHIAIDIRFDDVTMKFKLVVRPGIAAITVDENSFFSTILVFNPNWEYKNCNEYISQKIVLLTTTNKIHSQCDVSKAL